MDEITGLLLHVPTYHGARDEAVVAADERDEFGGPEVPVLIYREAGVRIVLGACDLANPDKPDIKIERRPHGWAVFLHPLGEGDPSGYVYFLDDGRSFLVRDETLRTTPAIRLLRRTQSVPGLDTP